MTVNTSPPTDARAHPYRSWIFEPGAVQACLQRLNEGGYPLVYVATPPAQTAAYLGMLADSGANLVVAEKPWFPDFATARRLAHRLRRSRVCFRFIDHYVFRGVVRWVLDRPLAALLGGPLTAITGWLLETSEPVSQAMKVGALADLLIHLLSISRQLLPARRIVVQEAHAARYRGAPGPPETFVHLRAAANGSVPVAVTLTAGKGIASEAAGKVLLLEGPGAVLWLDLAADTADRITAEGRVRIYPAAGEAAEEPYAVLLRQFAAGDRSIGFGLKEALQILRILDDARRLLSVPLSEYAKGGYPAPVMGSTLEMA
jgi:predicted dehydrogenase